MGVKKQAATAKVATVTKESAPRKRMQVQANSRVVKRLERSEALKKMTKAEKADILVAVLTAIKEEVAETGRCAITGLGIFSVVDVPERVRYVAFAEANVKSKAYKKLKFLPTATMTL